MVPSPPSAVCEDGPMMDQVRWGMIGCGNVTEVKSGPAFF
jgi:hypothetical protein